MGGNTQGRKDGGGGEVAEWDLPGTGSVTGAVLRQKSESQLEDEDGDEAGVSMYSGEEGFVEGRV